MNVYIVDSVARALAKLDGKLISNFRWYNKGAKEEYRKRALYILDTIDRANLIYKEEKE